MKREDFIDKYCDFEPLEMTVVYSFVDGGKRLKRTMKVKFSSVPRVSGLNYFDYSFLDEEELYQRVIMDFINSSGYIREVNYIDKMKRRVDKEALEVVFSDGRFMVLGSCDILVDFGDAIRDIRKRMKRDFYEIGVDFINNDKIRNVSIDSRANSCDSVSVVRDSSSNFVLRYVFGDNYKIFNGDGFGDCVSYEVLRFYFDKFKSSFGYVDFNGDGCVYVFRDGSFCIRDRDIMMRTIGVYEDVNSRKKLGKRK